MLLYDICFAGKGLQEGGNGKTPGAGKAARRVLGDVTNRTPGVQPGSAVTEPFAAQHQPAARFQGRAELYAAEGVERRAGKGWHQLETERLQRESAAAKQRAQDAILPWVTRRLPPQVNWAVQASGRHCSMMLHAAAGAQELREAYVVVVICGASNEHHNNLILAAGLVAAAAGAALRSSSSKGGGGSPMLFTLPALARQPPASRCDVPMCLIVESNALAYAAYMYTAAKMIPVSFCAADASLEGVLPADSAEPASLLPDIDDLLSSDVMNLND
jgi:hypothetical protein